MLSQSFIDFYNGWTEKANQIVGNNLSDVYDKYITLFITFNSLYNQVQIELVNKGIAIPEKIYDNEAATKYVVKYLGGKKILTMLSNSNNDNDVNSLIDIIDKELFYIKLKNGKRQRQDDLKILANLRSKDNTTKAKAILQVVYYVRCNMFHGQKEFVEYQRMLVEPLINILVTMNNYIFTELNK